MADAPKAPDATNDLKWLGKWLGIIFIVWLITGGPARIAQQKPFLKPPSPLDSGEQYGGTIGKPNWKGEFVPPASYHGENAKYFTVSLPKGWVLREIPSRDGYYSGEFTNDITTLTFDYGKSPSDLPVESELYTIVYERVDKIGTKFVTPKKTGDGVTGGYYRRWLGDDLTIAGDNLTTAEKNIAFTIMRSVQFK
jgi:hypothetical protein